jgi:hypothetical protein
MDDIAKEWPIYIRTLDLKTEEKSEEYCAQVIGTSVGKTIRSSKLFRNDYFRVAVSRKQCCGSMKFWYGSGCGYRSADLYL